MPRGRSAHLFPRPLRIVLIAALLALVASPAGAAEPRRPKVAVLDVRATGSAEPKLVSGLSTLLATEAAKHPVQVVAGLEIASLIGFEKQKLLLGCGDGACLAEITGGLGVDYLLASEVSEVGGIWLLSFSLIKVRDARTVERTTEKAKSAAALVELAGDAVAKVLEAITQPKLSQGGIAVHAKVSDRHLAGYVLDGAGGALLVGVAISGILSKLTFDQAKKAASPSEMESLKSKTNTEMIVADVLYAAGAAALGVGLVLTFTGRGEEQQMVSVGLAPARSGGALVVSGGF